MFTEFINITNPEKNSRILMDCFLSINIKVNSLSAKACFLALKADTPVASNLFKTANHFYIRKLK